jgi:hypothetical protein
MLQTKHKMLIYTITKDLMDMSERENIGHRASRDEIMLWATQFIRFVDYN